MDATQASVSEPVSVKDTGAESDKSKRHTAPVFSFNEILKFCSKIYTELGINSYHPNDEIARIHNVQYVSIKQKFSAAQELGLLEIKHGKGYKLTSLFMKIYKPINEIERIAGVGESLRSPFIYERLIDEFNGHPLPSDQSLSSRLIRSFGIKDYAAVKAANIFLSNLRDNGFVNGEGILSMGTPDQGTVKPLPGDQVPNGLNKPKENPPASGYIEIPIPLPSGKRAYLKIPEDYKTEDCDRIAKFVEALK